MTRRLVLLLAVLVAVPAHADPGGTVALLPLDAAAHLEIYGQPVASEIARELVAGGVDVVVVGPKMEVPATARLIVDGTITAGKGGAVVLAVRIRDRATGAVLDRLEATAPELTKIDRAASELSSRILPSVRGRLAEHAPAATPAAPAPLPGLAVAIGPGPLHDAFAPALAAWAARHHWQIADRDADATLTLTPLAYDVTPGTVALARARVRIEIRDAAHAAKFDRVVLTDTVVGDKGLPPAELAARTAREVLDIVEPHMRRAIATWK